MILLLLPPVTQARKDAIRRAGDLTIAVASRSNEVDEELQGADYPVRVAADTAYHSMAMFAALISAAVESRCDPCPLHLAEAFA